MAKDRMAVLTALMEQAVVPVFSHTDVSLARGVIEACARGGAPCVEFTDRGAFAAEAFRELSRALAGSDVILGVGTVMDAPTAALFLSYGARFVVSPIVSADIAKVCNRRKVAYLPGCATTTEISFAEELGCEIVKMFPGGPIGGPDFVKNVLGPMPWTKIMPTGGVEPTRESLKAWFDAGVVAVGMGSKLITPALIEKRDFARIEKNVRDAVALARSVRGLS